MKISQTAQFVGLLRALASRGFTQVAGFRDPFVERLLSPRWRAALTWLTPRVLAAPEQARDAALGRLDGLALRVLAIDRELELAVAAGCQQVVILGAGLDTRAHRLSELAATTVYEVDRPATQREKRARAAGLPLTAADLRYVEVDFERDALGSKLMAAGHSRALPSAWIWEGVVMYLSDAALSTTLRAIAAASAPGSRLIVHYHEPDRFDLAARAMRGLTRVWGEPQIGLRSRVELRSAVTQAGFESIRDSGASDWAETYRVQLDDSELVRVSRLIVAHKRAG